MQDVWIGSPSHYISIELPQSFSADGWAHIAVAISVDAFQGRIQPFAEAHDFANFARQLRLVYDTLKGEASFTPIENQFALQVAAGTGGAITLSGHAYAQASYGSRLVFELPLDQSYLLTPLRQLEEFCESIVRIGRQQ